MLALLLFPRRQETFWAMCLLIGTLGWSECVSRSVCVCVCVNGGGGGGEKELYIFNTDTDKPASTDESTRTLINAMSLTIRENPHATAE